MRAFTLGSCLAIAVTITFSLNQLIDAALRPLPSLEGHASIRVETPGAALDSGRLARLFGTPLRPIVPPPARRPVPLKLLGTLDDHAAAILDPISGQCRTLRIGDAWDDVELLGVGHGQVLVLHAGIAETLGMHAVPSAPVASALGISVGATGGKVSIPRAELESRLPEFTARLMNEGRMVPSFTGSTMTGLKLFALRPGSLYEELGFKSGDVVEAVNGTPLARLDTGMGAMIALRSQSRIQVAVNRNGEHLTWELNVN